MRILITAIFFTTVSCNLLVDEKEDVPNPIAEFVSSENLPNPQEIEIFLNLENDQFSGFSVKFGDEMDLPINQSFNTATGFKLEDKIGWIIIQNFGGYDISNKTFFEIETSDSLLYSQRFWQELEKSNSVIYRYRFLYILSEDPFTPIPVLKRLANDLYTFENRHQADLLIENNTVMESKQVLEILANLPFFPKDPYKGARERAQELLKNFE